MDVFFTELGIQLSFVKTSEFRAGFEPPPKPHLPHDTPLTEYVAESIFMS
jgi:hypothetical protein